MKYLPPVTKGILAIKRSQGPSGRFARRARLHPACGLARHCYVRRLVRPTGNGRTEI